MTTPDPRDAWKETFRKAGALAVTRPDPERSGLALSAHLPAGSLVAAAERLKAEGFTLLFITTADFSEGLLVTYVFDSFTEHLRMALRVLVTDRSRPEVPSLAQVYEGAEWHERESYDFYGMIFTGNPNPVPLLLPGDDPIPPPHLKAPDVMASIRKLGFLGETLWAEDGWELAPEAPKAEAKPAAEARPAADRPASEAKPVAADKPAAEAKPEAGNPAPETRPAAEARPEAGDKPAGGGKEEGK
ncbi:MAG: NADH-quinone oxidoreductase subunit C [Deltaproteobacteria bacterium]|jgi:NADH-quinone oxidoreductase subunit C|nr:NADH-quinone oxidoreductase subunit C [Deltaproteobacteria bacterium]